ncbi:T9SS type A sorting domain-containing protein [Epilithonimonas zeae]|uniref:Por secretion system C-terminal sorting domain-containing protein n=1 Tax=Epilithonimonas zeae TaxID=1416779 RepID=A0A1N6F4C3_9FLAO|nr:T9SS type A sorting domain-containing protein [Epilithonimonas zeae]SIN90115.1 Por secretion system C-terminal sorting domain-containing protein [Epilithonimonas zeae]
MKKFTLLFVMCCGFINAQFTTPNNGTTYTLASLSAAAPTVLQDKGTFYMMMDDITISATDKLIIDQNTTLSVNSDKTLYVFGEYKTTATNFLINSVDSGFPFKGIRFEDGSVVEMRNTRVDYAGGIRVLTANFLMDNCIVYKNHGGVSTSGALGFSKGSPVVSNSQFIENRKAAFGSAANATVSATFINNYISGNVTDNSNTPQINMGPGGADSLKIINNTIIGDRTKIMVGGISASALTGGVNKFRIEGNTIRDNRYGITSYGSTSSGVIRNNIIENNNTQNDPNLGGSGISISSAKDVVIAENEIRGNLWGITLLNNATVKLGTEESPGNNIFKNNVNNGNTVALFNNTTNIVNAVGNCWRENELSNDAMVLAVIGSQTANTINFKPYNCAETLAVSDVSKSKLSVYPNPSKNHFFLETENAGNIVIQDISGKVVFSSIVNKGRNEINTNLQSGVYIITQQSEGKKSNTKLIIK